MHQRMEQDARFIALIVEPQWNGESPPVAKRISANRARLPSRRALRSERWVWLRTQGARMMDWKAWLEHASRSSSARSSSCPDYFENDLGRLIRTRPLVTL